MAKPEAVTVTVPVSALASGSVSMRHCPAPTEPVVQLARDFVPSEGVVSVAVTVMPAAAGLPPDVSVAVTAPSIDPSAGTMTWVGLRVSDAV